LITVKDIEKTIQYPNACKDERGRLRVGAAVGVGADWERAGRWLGARWSRSDRSGYRRMAIRKNVLDVIGQIRRRYPDLDLAAATSRRQKARRR
jgi:IMP dehydrogenase